MTTISAVFDGLNRADKIYYTALSRGWQEMAMATDVWAVVCPYLTQSSEWLSFKGHRAFEDSSLPYGHIEFRVAGRMRIKVDGDYAELVSYHGEQDKIYIDGQPM